MGAGKTNLRGRLSTVDLLIKQNNVCNYSLPLLKVACLFKKVNNGCNIKVANLNYLVVGGQLY